MANVDIMAAPSLEQEEWRPIPGFEWSEASSFGRIRSLPHTVEFMKMGRWNIQHRKGIIRKYIPSPNPAGIIYYRVKLLGGRFDLVNRIICSVFHGDPPTSKHHAAHLDGNSLNNRSDNLAWKTPLENGADKILHGTPARGRRNFKAKLSDADIPNIFVAYINGVMPSEIADGLGVHMSNISYIVKRKTWTHVFVAPDIIAKAQAMAKANHRRIR